MKRFLPIIISLMALSFVVESCSKEDELAPVEHRNFAPTVNVNLDTLKQVKILFIGHSYVNDALSHVKNLCTNLKVDVSDMAIYSCYRGSASFQSWYRCWNDGDNSTYSIFNKLENVGLEIPGIACDEVDRYDGSKFRNVVENYQWDIVVFCNSNSGAADWEDTSQSGYFGELLSIVREHQPAAKFYYMWPHARWLQSTDKAEDVPYASTQTMWASLAEKMKWVLAEKGIDKVIPVGTTIENLRKTSLNREDSIPTYNLTRDGNHLGIGLAQYAASCCVFESLIAPRKGVTVKDNTLRPRVTNASKYTFPGGCISVTDENAPVAIWSALLAIEHPYELSDVEKALSSQTK